MQFLSEIFRKNDIIINKNQENQFDLFFHYLVQENEKFNLTAITDEREVVVKHFLDSVLPADQIPQNAKVVDIGSGAGFPAVPLKIVRPDIDLCMVDSLNKRVNFLNEAISMLNLTKTRAIHARAEDFAQKNRETFDIAVARAVAPLNTLVEYLLPLIKIGGQAIIYKSSKLDEELAISKNAISILGAKVENCLEFNIEDLQRRILILEKTNKTPAKYPRGQNKPKTNPIV